jgi:hypothetical protein
MSLIWRHRTGVLREEYGNWWDCGVGAERIASRRVFFLHDGRGDFPGRSKRTLATKGEFIHSFDRSIIQTTHAFIDQAFELKKQVT